jgi:copper chaperone CopZ
MHGCCSVPPNRKKFDLADYHQARLARLAISGMRCAGCAERIAASLLELGGVVGAKVDDQLGTADVTFIPGRVRPTALVEAVSCAGENGHSYRARLLNGAELSGG